MSSFLPTLTVNRVFIKALIAAKAPCCGLGLVEVEEQKRGFLVLRPGEVIPAERLDDDFKFGYSLYGSSRFKVVRFSFEFYGFDTYHVLVNPNNPLSQVVLKTMLESGDYFFCSIEERSDSFIAFRHRIDKAVMARFEADWPRIASSRTTEIPYLQALSTFSKDPAYLSGKLMHWVCLDNLSYLDLRIARLDLIPSPFY